METGLRRTGGAAALGCALLYVVTLPVYLVAMRGAQPPATALEWLQLFRANPITGLFYLGLADLVISLFWVPMVLALHRVLGRGEGRWTTVAAGLALVGVAVYLSTCAALPMLSLSRRFDSALVAGEHSALLGGAEALIATSEGSLGMAVVWFSGVILSLIMRGGSEFGRATAWIGIAGFCLLLASVPLAGYTTAGSSTVVRSLAVGVTYSGGGLLSLVWYLRVGVRLLRPRRPRAA